MKLLFFMAEIFVMGYFALAILQSFSSQKWTKWSSFYLAVFFAFLVFISFFGVPSRTDDLYRWYANVNWYRMGMPAFYFASSTLREIQTDVLFLFDFSMWAVGKTPYNGFLQVIWLLLNFLTVWLVVYKFAAKYEISNRVVYSSIILYFALTPFFYSLSGLRYNTVCAWIFLGVYIAIFEKKKKWIFLLLIVATFVHQSAAMLFMIWAVCHYGEKIKAQRLLVLWTLMVDFLSYLVGLVPLEIFQFISTKLYYYFHDFQYTTDWRLKVILLVLLIVLLVSVLYMEKHKDIWDSPFEKYLFFLEGVIWFCLGAIFNDTLFLRGIYFLGCCLLPYNFMIYSIFKKKRQCAIVEMFLGLGLNAYYLVTLTTYFHFVV